MRRGFLLGVAATVLAIGVTGCVSKQITVPYNSDASCSVTVHGGQP